MWANIQAPLVRPHGCPQILAKLRTQSRILRPTFCQLKWRICEVEWDVNLTLEKKGRSRVGGISCAASESGGQKIRNWVKSKIDEKQKAQVAPGEKVMRMITTATSAPVAQYIAEPVTALHTIDPRVKLAWLLALVVLPSRSPISVRLGLVLLLLLATVFSLPRRIWQDQLSRTVLLSVLLFVFTALGTDGVPPVVQQRTPPPSFDGLPEVLPSLVDYSYVVMKFGPLQLTRKGLALAAAASCLSFTVLQSTTICLTTTTPEHLAAGLRWFLAPLSRFRAPVDETIFTLLLSIRFIGLVFDEVRSIALAVVARGVYWKGLKLMETADTFFTLCARVLKNLLNQAEKISEAMVARGFKGDSSKHHVYFLTPLSLKRLDKLAILGLVFLTAGTVYWQAV